MHQQAQLRLKKDEVEKLGAEVFVVLAMDLHRTRMFCGIPGFGVQDQALMELITGAAEPSALLPLQMPADMETVEAQFEDAPHDMKCYVDAEGNTYDFGFGLNWKGLIKDQRTSKYKKSVPKP